VRERERERERERGGERKNTRELASVYEGAIERATETKGEREKYVRSVCPILYKKTQRAIVLCACSSYIHTYIYIYI